MSGPDYPAWSYLLVAAGTVAGVLPTANYYLHAFTGLGGPSVALRLSRARYVLAAAGLLACAASDTGAHPVVFGIEFHFAPHALLGGAAVLVAAAILQWRSIVTRFVPDADARPVEKAVPDTAPVIAVTDPPTGPPRAYLLDWVAARHLVHDASSGVVVSHCPLAQSAAVFRPLPGPPLKAALPHAGHYLVAADRGPAWSQVTGEAVVGDAPPLEFLPFRLCTWGEAKRRGIRELVAGEAPNALPSAADQSCMVAPAGMPVDEPLRAVVPGRSVAVEWAKASGTGEGVRVPVDGGEVWVRRDPVDGAAVAEFKGNSSGSRPEPVVLVRASVVDRLVASGRSKLRLA